MAKMMKFHKTFKTVTHKPYSEEVEQVFPEVGLVFSVADNGFGSGHASAYVITEVGRLNARGFPKKFVAKPLHKTYPPMKQQAGLYNNGNYTISEDGTECLVGGDIEEFRFRRSNGEAYFKHLCARLSWGRIIKSDYYDK